MLPAPIDGLAGGVVLDEALHREHAPEAGRICPSGNHRGVDPLLGLGQARAELAAFFDVEHMRRVARGIHAHL
mgnify:CR=1 FL=1